MIRKVMMLRFILSSVGLGVRIGIRSFNVSAINLHSRISRVSRFVLLWLREEMTLGRSY